MSAHPQPSPGNQPPAADSEGAAHSDSLVEAAVDCRDGQKRAHDGGASDSRPTAASAGAYCSEQGQSDLAAHPPPAAAVVLHRHALESIFAFLGLRELAAVLCVARDWTAAVGSMRRLELSVSRPSVPLAALAQSAMGRHVSSVWSVRLDAETLTTLNSRMGHLRHLHGVLQLPPAQPLIFPASLRRLQIDFPDHADAAQINTAVTAVGSLALLEELCVTLSWMAPQISLAPLAALPLLRCLKVDVCGLVVPFDLSDAQIVDLRALPKLQQLSVHASGRLLRRLLRQPHALQWQKICLPNLLDDETAALLPQLPSLTAITELVTCERFDWLRGLPNLTDVDLAFDSPEGDDGRAASLVAGLQCCANVETLRLDGCHDLTAAHLAELLPRLTRLRDLSLESLRVDSLAFLAQPPLVSQLSRLQLQSCDRLPLAELRHVHSLRGLKKLGLHDSFDAPLDERRRSQLTPPSALLPLLEEFQSWSR